MTLPFKVYIPARYHSSRLPGKALLTIGDKTLVRHVYDAASRSSAVEVVIATDDERIRREAGTFGARVIMTSAEHDSGTERIAEAVRKNNEDDDTVIVNVQGDEYALPPALIDQVANILHDNGDIPVATLCERITDAAEFESPDVVKVVADRRGRALYFSRSPIPWRSGPVEAGEGFDSPGWRHIGIYAYRTGYLKEHVQLPACELERFERLEQLRMLYNDIAVYVAEACAESGIGIDTEDDLQRARKAVTSNKS